MVTSGHGMLPMTASIYLTYHNPNRPGQGLKLPGRIKTMSQKKMVSIRLTPETIKKIDAMAEKALRARTNYIEYIVTLHAEGKKWSCWN